MKYLSAYALAWLGGKANPSVKDLESIITAAGGSFDKAHAESLVESLKDKDLAEVIRTGLPKIQAAGGAGVSSSGSTAAKVEVVETKKEEKKDEKKDEDADFDGALEMFGDDDY